MATRQNVQRNVIGRALYLNTWLWAIGSDRKINGVLFSNCLLGIASVLTFIYFFYNEDHQKEEVRMFRRVIALLSLFPNLIYMVNMELSKMHILATTTFLVIIVLIILYYKKYGLQIDETD